MSNAVNNSSYFNLPCGRIKKETLAKIVLLIASVVLIALAIGVYFYGSHYLPQIFQTTTQRIIGTTILGVVGLGLDIVALILHCCQKETIEPVKPPTVPLKGCLCTTPEEEQQWDDEQRFFLIALGEEAYDTLYNEFLAIYEEEESFEITINRLRQSYSDKKGIFFLFNALSSELQLGGVGGQTGLKKGSPLWDISFEEGAASGAQPSTSIWRASRKIIAPYFKAQVPVDIKNFSINFEDKVFYL